MGYTVSNPQELLSLDGIFCGRVGLRFDPVDVATLVLSYYTGMDRIIASGGKIDPDHEVIPYSDIERPPQPQDIKGIRPIGQLSKDSPARGFSFGQVRTALDCLYVEYPDHWHTLRDELGSPMYGARVRSEHDSIAKTADRVRDTYLDATEYRTNERSELLAKCDELIAKASRDMAQLRNKVIEAASVLTIYLPQPTGEQ